ncbi:hypothetical protein EON77_15865, partial [bacterium]
MSEIPTSPPPSAAGGVFDAVRGVALRFAAIYFTLFFLSDRVPIWTSLVEAVGRTFWGITEVSNGETGSGDRLYDWLLVAGLLGVSAAGAVLWSALAALVARRWPVRSDASPRGIGVHEYLRVILRYSLAIMIFAYGFAKTAQFPTPDTRELATPLGEGTPMALMWSFMGASVPYSLFSGTLEILG